MDKTWIKLNKRSSSTYIQGVVSFLEYAFDKSSKDGKILCPCRKCVNVYWHTKSEVIDHLICNGFLRNYVNWIHHGEGSSSLNHNQDTNEEEMGFHHNIYGMLEDAMLRVTTEGNNLLNANEDVSNLGGGQNREQLRNGNVSNKFFELVKDAEQNLYPNCPESKLATAVMLYHLKCLNGWSNKSFNQLLEYLNYLLPKDNLLPKSHSEIKSLLKSLGLGYEKILACPNDCMLFWKDKEKEEVCSVCGASKWLPTPDGEEPSTDNTVAKKKKKAAKVLRWFPLKPRLQRLFSSSKTTSLMRWHDEGRIKDGLLRHPADVIARKHFDSIHLEFSSESRNIRLGLASDGFNPFKNMNVAHSTWLVILIPYNLPPWICMKQSNFILSLLIPGPKGPGNKIDVYLQPLIEELKDLWDHGVDTYDASKNESFKLRAALMWTINDFPALAILSGWSTRGEKACPCCGYETESMWLECSKKYCYMGHRRWLCQSHKFRQDKKSFDGTQELRKAPTRTSGTTILSHAASVEDGTSQPLKKISIFFTLPYWEHNLLRHNIDMMHTEKNVFDNTFGTTFGQEGKSKDNYKARCDLMKLGIRSELFPKTTNGSSRKSLPHACYKMTKKEKDAFLKVLKEMKVPDEYSSNISKGVRLKQRKIIGLKTYDCHIMMQELLPVAIRGSLPKEVALVIIERLMGSWS